MTAAHTVHAPLVATPPAGRSTGPLPAVRTHSSTPAPLKGLKFRLLAYTPPQSPPPQKLKLSLFYLTSQLTKTFHVLILFLRWPSCRNLSTPSSSLCLTRRDSNPTEQSLSRPPRNLQSVTSKAPSLHHQSHILAATPAPSPSQAQHHATSAPRASSHAQSRLWIEPRASSPASRSPSSATASPTQRSPVSRSTQARTSS